MLIRIRLRTACAQPAPNLSGLAASTVLLAEFAGTIARVTPFAKRRFAPISISEETLRVSRRGAFPVPETHLLPRRLEKPHRQGCAIRNVIDIVGRMKSCFVIF
jgi:hypothetical protein